MSGLARGYRFAMTGKLRPDARASRKERLAAALRANLKRRKAQARVRAAGEREKTDGAAPAQSRESR